jgi:hypothetical protein
MHTIFPFRNQLTKESINMPAKKKAAKAKKPAVAKKGKVGRPAKAKTAKPAKAGAKRGPGRPRKNA